MEKRVVSVGRAQFGSDQLCCVLGPCVIESRELVFRTCEFLLELCTKLELPFVFKSSYDKANRSSVESFRGPGLHRGLEILDEVKQHFGVPVLSDVHTPEEVDVAQEVLDVLQVPAFLCRQTDLLISCGRSAKPVQVKKGQFLSPWDMQQVVEKLEHAGCRDILLIDRGTTFGYNNLVCDVRSVPVMEEFGYPVGFDATHGVMLPGGLGHASSGQRQFIPALAKAYVAAGADFVFLETHPDPKRAKSDAQTQVPLEELEDLLRALKCVFEAVRG